VSTDPRLNLAENAGFWNTKQQAQLPLPQPIQNQIKSETDWTNKLYVW